MHLQLTKLKLKNICLLLLALCSVFLSELKANCTKGETEAIFSFMNQCNSANELATLEWDYAINGLISDSRVLLLMTVVTISVYIEEYFKIILRLSLIEGLTNPLQPIASLYN